MPDLILPDEKTFDIEISYWNKKLHGVSPLLLSTDFNRINSVTNNISSTKFTIDKNVTEKLSMLAKEQNASLLAILLAAFKTLLYRHSDQEDICVGNAVVEADQINLLALRSELTGEDEFNDVLKRVNNTTLEALKNQKTPFEIVANNFVQENKDDNPFFKIMFLLQNDVAIAENILTEVQKNEIAFVLNEGVSGIEGKIYFKTDLYRESSVDLMAGHYLQLLDSIISTPQAKIGALPMLTDAERNDIQVKFNDTLTYYPSEKTIVDLFEEQVKKTPDAIALRQHDQTMTYREVNEKANQLARYLVEHGVKPADNVGLLVARRFSMIIGMYGIMKAGGAYVPIDPEYPTDRQEYILNNSSVGKIVTDDNYALEELVSAEHFVKFNSLDLSSYSTDDLGLKIDSKQLAYTIYTSGSTGRPKGVMIEHHSAVNLILWVNNEYNIGASDRLLFITSMCFDLSVYDIFGILAAGGAAVIVEHHELMDMRKLKELMLKYKITFWDSVPTTMDYLVRELESSDDEYVQNALKVVFMSGDWIPVNLPDRIKRYFPKTQVISLGGATEGTIWSNFFPVKEVGKDWGSIPYGRPLANNFFYILNEQLQPVPLGVPGELYIGGVGVARGYANDKQKTDYSFVKDPFNDKAGGRMYRTGDLGRMLPGLNMEFIGRKDDQVKINGFRVELGEIESVMRQSEWIQQAVVLAKSDKNKQKRLVAYVVGKGGYKREEVVRFLKSKLPDYMVPTIWMELDSLPLTSNNKIDKKALPDFEAEELLKDNYVAASTPTEKIMAGIWQDVLKLQQVGVEDNFFDVGGHSLLAVQITTRVEKKLDKRLPLATLFSYPTIASLSAFIDKDKESAQVAKWKTIVPIKPTGNKMPIYIAHGAGLNVLTFHDLEYYVESDQPIFGLQAVGLDGEEVPFNSIQEIATYHVNEIIKHNPKGPYALAGYSIGGFIAAEIGRQLQQMNKEIKMLAIFDTDADNARENEPWYIIMPKVIRRYLPEFLGGKKSFSKQLLAKSGDLIDTVKDKMGLTEKPESAEYYNMLNALIKRYFSVLKKYKFTPIDIPIYLFKADFNDHYNDDEVYLGWEKYTSKGVKRYPVPGNHLTMMIPENAEKLGRALQSALNDCQ